MFYDHKCHNLYLDISTKNDEVVLDDYQFDDNVVLDCLSHLLEQVVELVNVTDETMVNLATDQNKISKTNEDHLLHIFSL
jgi:hypothetical protein